VEETAARVGGGALPLTELPSFACAIEEPLFGPLRRGEPPVVGIVRDGRLLLDVRALRDGEVDEVAAAVVAARAALL
jgi:L-seryl-tRNA(Ser) seleniumtransferase